MRRMGRLSIAATFGRERNAVGSRNFCVLTVVQCYFFSTKPEVPKYAQLSMGTRVELVENCDTVPSFVKHN